jgi:hypothetical protein
VLTRGETQLNHAPSCHRGSGGIAAVRSTWRAIVRSMRLRSQRRPWTLADDTCAAVGAGTPAIVRPTRGH